MRDLLHENRVNGDRRHGERRRYARSSSTMLTQTPKDDPTPRSRRLWDARDVANFLKASRNWVYQQAELGKIPCVRIGGLLRFDPEKVKALANGELLPVSTARLK